MKERHKQGLTPSGTTRTGETVEIAVHVVAPGIVYVLLTGEKPDPGRVALARDLSDQAVGVSLEESRSEVTLVSDLVKVRINLDPFHMTFYGPDGRVVLDQSYTAVT